ncbi:MAG: prepilin-type N-terminal cleavage/methylation domain-containing protein [Oscillospiraceae bacterium]|nr:prepilin-type N-terminal cleavage/methylation domain-containing protein [Oscillospiraceae bacterium]
MRNSKVKGFTLVELIVVIAIIAILAAILVPSMLGYIRNSRITQADANAKNIHTAATAAVAQAYVDGNLGAPAATDTGVDVTNLSISVTLTGGTATTVSLADELGGSLDGKARVWYNPGTAAVTGAAWTANANSTIPANWPTAPIAKSANPIVGYFPAVDRES